MIRNAIREELELRKSQGIKINGKSPDGRYEIDKRVAELVNTKVPQKYHISAEDVRLYKKCFIDEYQDRTGKCAWGFKDVRKKLGFDPDTGLELKN